jgi:hypothetical protein
MQTLTQLSTAEGMGRGCGHHRAASCAPPHVRVGRTSGSGEHAHSLIRVCHSMPCVVWPVGDTLLCGVPHRAHVPRRHCNMWLRARTSQHSSLGLPHPMPSFSHPASGLPCCVRGLLRKCCGARCPASHHPLSARDNDFILGVCGHANSTAQSSSSSPLCRVCVHVCEQGNSHVQVLGSWRELFFRVRVGG